MKGALVVITDGRWDYLNQTLESAEQQLQFQWTQKLLIDDSGAPYGPQPYGFDVVRNRPRKGLAGAIETAWEWLDPDIDFIFHLEDDFVFVRTIPVQGMVDLLVKNPHLAQMALLRQPWSPAEHAAGGIYGVTPDAYCQRDGYVEQSRLFTFNPCVYLRHITAVGAGLEAEVTERLLALDYVFGYFGKLDDEPRCHHIGVRRSKDYKL